MVLTRKVVYGFNGYSAPDIPRAPRSIRKRGLHKKAIEEGQLCAFDLLATVALKLLQENEGFSSFSTSIAALGGDHYEASQNAFKTEKMDVDNLIRTENDDRGSSQESVFYSGLCFQNCDKKEAYKENGSEANAENASIVVSSACLGKTDFDVKSIVPKSEDKFVKIHCKVEEGSPTCGEGDNTTMGDGIIKQSKVSGEMDEHFTTANKFSPKYTADLCRSTTRSTSRFRYRTNVKIGGTDNDEVISRCSQLSAKAKTDSSPARIGDRRIRKLLTSQQWKVAPKLQDSEPSNSGSNLKHFYNNRKSCYAHERTESDTPLKKRKLLDQSSVVSHDGGVSSESVSNLPEKGTEDRKGKGASPSMVGHQRSSDSRNSPVKFTIKSFKVPELFIEVPKCTTVGSLKRTVLEAVTAIIGDGLCVGVFMEGKKIRDDNKTLLQSGISQNDNLDSLGFMLEPISPKPPPSLSPDESSAPLTYVSSKDIVNRTQVFQKVPSFPVDGPDNPSVPDLGSQAGGSQGLASSTAAEVLAKKRVPDSKVLVPISEANMEALADVPLSLRSKHSEIWQRRTRRPFSVVEVEALVLAVEKLGTGRWRDVKLCAFVNAKHRTYVDLKDKWKTLVHTARISPQQRRGEPVPQKLLDRVLAAHGFWSQHQAKQNGKQQQQPGLLGLTDTYEPAERQQSCVDFL